MAGVASGLARHLGVEPLPVRLTFVALTVAGGTGLLLYAAFWAFVPQAPGAGPVDGAAPTRERAQVPALAAVAVGGLLLAAQLGLFASQAVVWPALVIGAGVALVWRQADEAQRRRWLGDTRSGGSTRVVAGVVLLVIGAATFLVTNVDLAAARDGVIAVLVVVAGLAVTFAPWWWRMVEDLRRERHERIRSQERAEVAAHLHDSVLQTLALIQRSAASPAEVQRLARRQERELRAWLFDRETATEGRFVAAIRAAATEVEDAHRTTIEVVAVGDCDVDERLWAVVQAAREAMVNAAKFAGVDVVDVFVEIEEDDVEVFVRDTGIGFDPEAVPADRHGLAESIAGRMARHGGVAVVRTAPGEGTEIELRMSRAGVRA